MQCGVMSRRLKVMSSQSFPILPQLSATLLGMFPRRVHASGSQEAVRAGCGNLSIGRANLSIGCGNVWISLADASLCRVAWASLAAPRARAGRDDRGSGPPLPLRGWRRSVSSRNQSTEPSAGTGRPGSSGRAPLMTSSATAHQRPAVLPLDLKTICRRREGPSLQSITV